MNIDSFSSKAQTDVLYTDFNKAFDRIDHNLLILKLKTFYGINDPLLSWFASFLSEKQQIVKLYNNFLSTSIHASFEVPQRDHISPLLFLLFINDVSLILNHSKILLSADDAIKIYKTIKSMNDITIRLG